MEDNPVVSGGTIRGVRKPSGKGNHLIILHAGGGNGCVNSADLVFQSKKATDDDHDEMKAAHFEEWFHDSLLPNLQSNSLIVMDNAPYHSRNSNLCLPCIGVGNGVQRGPRFPHFFARHHIVCMLQRSRVKRGTPLTISFLHLCHELDEAAVARLANGEGNCVSRVLSEEGIATVDCCVLNIVGCASARRAQWYFKVRPH